MKTNLLLAITVAFVMAMFTSKELNAQSKKCYTMGAWNNKYGLDESASIRRAELDNRIRSFLSNRASNRAAEAVITIPVVVHVLWHTDEENISDEQIWSQIDVLNEDFRLLNSDSLTEDHPFWFYTADCQIEFCLASVDPNGDPTNGITRTYTDVVSFTGEGDEKYSSLGGTDNWDPYHYLNLWVCNLSASGGTLGYATFPSDLDADPDADGVVINYTAFGVFGTATAPNDLGRTATHEVGHWLDLRHIWGDEVCGDDFVDDTAPAREANYSCPVFPHNPFSECGTDENGEMYMNFMDYVDDDCMNMFTFGQSDRMYAAISTARAELFNSNGCATGAEVSNLNEEYMNLWPNPAYDQLRVSVHKASSFSGFVVYDIAGKAVLSKNAIGSSTLVVDISTLESGVYTLSFQGTNGSFSKKFIKI